MDVLWSIHLNHAYPCCGRKKNCVSVSTLLFRNQFQNQLCKISIMILVPQRPQLSYITSGQKKIYVRHFYWNVYDVLGPLHLKHKTSSNSSPHAFHSTMLHQSLVKMIRVVFFHWENIMESLLVHNPSSETYHCPKDSEKNSILNLNSCHTSSFRVYKKRYFFRLLNGYICR